MTLPPQHPEPAPRYRFRPRNDHYTAFRAPMTPRVVEQPWERFPENEPRDLDWRELRDPTLIVAAVGIVLGGGLVLAFWFTT